MLNRPLIVAFLALLANGPSLGEPHANADTNNAANPHAMDSKGLLTIPSN
jgi:hypothetical protein